MKGQECQRVKSEGSRVLEGQECQRVKSEGSRVPFSYQIH